MTPPCADCGGHSGTCYRCTECAVLAVQRFYAERPARIAANAVAKREEARETRRRRKLPR